DRVLVEQVVDLDKGSDPVGDGIARADVEVQGARHMVVVDRWVVCSRGRAVALADYVLVAEYAIAEPALGQVNTHVVPVPTLKSIQLPVRGIADGSRTASRTAAVLPSELHI